MAEEQHRSFVGQRESCEVAGVGACGFKDQEQLFAEAGWVLE